MELDLIKYFAFLISSTALMGWMFLWLKSNKKKREEEKNQEN